MQHLTTDSLSFPPEHLRFLRTCCQHHSPSCLAVNFDSVAVYSAAAVDSVTMATDQHCLDTLVFVAVAGRRHCFRYLAALAHIERSVAGADNFVALVAALAGRIVAVVLVVVECIELVVVVAVAALPCS